MSVKPLKAFYEAGCHMVCLFIFLAFFFLGSGGDGDNKTLFNLCNLLCFLCFLRMMAAGLLISIINHPAEE